MSDMTGATIHATAFDGRFLRCFYPAPALNLKTLTKITIDRRTDARSYAAPSDGAEAAGALELQEPHRMTPEQSLQNWRE